MRGFFGIGVESISKPMNIGSLFRSAHAFGASFVFVIAPVFDVRASLRSDTSATSRHVPLYVFDSVDEFKAPHDCRLVGVELLDDAVDLPSFAHPDRAAYVLGPERGSLSPSLTERCDFTVKIPTKFCVNVGIAGAILMYDRQLSKGGFPSRPVAAGGPLETAPTHVHGGRFTRRKT